MIDHFFLTFIDPTINRLKGKRPIQFIACYYCFFHYFTRDFSPNMDGKFLLLLTEMLYMDVGQRGDHML